MHVLENYFDIDLIPDYCTKEKLEKFYGYYLKNLKSSPYRTKWVTLNEIENRDFLNWECIGDKYLEESRNDKKKLAMDIYQNGTYFPIFVIQQENAPFRLRDGIHRLFAMRQLVELGLWEEDRKVLVATDEEVCESGKNDQNVYFLPLVVKEEFKKNFPLMYKEVSRMEPLDFADPEKEFVVYRSANGKYLAMSCLSLLLRNAFYEYRQRYGESIKPSPVINNIGEWKKWRGY